MSEFHFEERPYQKEAVERVLQQFGSGRESVLLESPVGSGKTVMGLLLIQHLQRQSPGLRVNWVASRRHILHQVAILNDAYFHCQLNPVSVFASNPPKADLVVLDEAHHEATQSCIDMYEKTGNSLTLGLSATPLRTDRMRLAFQTNVQCGNIQYFINTGVLSPFHSYKTNTWDLDQWIKIYCDEPERWGKTLAFFSRIEECRRFQAGLRSCGIVCDVVTGDSNKDAQLEAFISGETQVVANVSVLSEGFDLPDLQSVFLRDASRLPTIQMAGRGLRRNLQKTHCNFLQSSTTKYEVERIAEPQESFRYRDGKWLSCSGNTEAIMTTMENTLAMLKDRKVALPFYFRLGRMVRQVTLKEAFRRKSRFR